MATLRHDTVMRNSDGQTMSAMVTAANIGTYGVAANSTYYVGTTQNIFNRASGAQSLTGVSIDGNAATVTNGVYTTGAQTIGGTKTFSDGVVVNGATYYTFNKPTTNAYQTVALFGSAGAGLFLTTDSAIIGVGAYYNNGWIATATSGRQIDFAGGSFTFGAFSGATVGGAAGWGTVATLSSAGSFVATGDVRTIIFYDSNNTAYYCDPASTSNLVGLTVANTITGSVSGNAATATNVAWTGITGGARTNYLLEFQPPANSYAGFAFKTSAAGEAGYFLVKGTADGDVYTAEGITLVADAGWLTLAQRTTASRGVKIMTGTASLDRFKITTAGDVQIVNGNTFTYNSNVVIHAGNYTSYPDATKLPLAGGTLTGNLTITKAGAYLYLNGTNSDSELRFMANSSDRWAVGMNVGDATENLNIYNYTTTTVNFTILKASGNVGIGITNPTQKLHVVGVGYSDTDFRAPIFYDSNNTAYYLDPANSGTSLLVAGKVGIGTTSPGAPLEVSGASGDGVPTFKITSTSAPSTFNYAGTMFNSSLGASKSYSLMIGKSAASKNSGYIGYNHSGTDGSNTNFLTFGHFQSDYLLNILGNGNVGIGTTSPAYKLDVGASGNDVISVRLTPGYERVRFHTFDLLGYNDGNLWMIGNNPTATLVLGKSWDWDNQIGIAYTAGTVGAAGGSLEIGQLSKNNVNFTHGNTRFYTNGIERIRITSAGNVGIGTTTPDAPLVIYRASGDSYLKISGSSTTYVILSDGTSNGYLLKNATSSTSNNALAGALYTYTDSNKAFQHIHSGTPLFTILSGGNVGIGTTSPANKLHVVGSAYSDTDFRAPIFYDSNDTGYFLNPNSTSNLNNLRAATISAANHGLTCVYYGGGATPTNGYLITTNIDYSTFNMPTVIIEGYAYGNGVPIHLEIVWYAYNNSWTNLAYTNLGNWNPGTVSIGTNASGKVCLHLSSLIYYGRFNVRCIYDGGNAPLEGWTVTDATTSALTRVTTISKVELATSITGNAATTTNGLTTSNYVSYSAFSGSVTSTYGNFTTPGLIIGDAQYGFYVVSGNVYYKSASGGIHYWRNIANNANTMSLDNSGNLTAAGYLQTTSNLIYPSTYGVTQRLEVSNAANNAWIDGLTIAPGGIVTAYGDSRAPIFYDSNNTAYYLDPASTSNLNALTVAGGNATIYRDLIVNGGASGNFGNRIIVQGTATTYTYQDTTLRPIVYLNGEYPVLTLNATAAGNTLHGPTLQFAFNGLTTGGATSRQIVIGAPGTGSWLDFGFSGGANGDNSTYNPHNGIGGYNGVTAMRLFSNGLLLGSTGAYPSAITSTSFALDVRGTGSSNTDFRAPIFYDSNNTAYYLDPASTSNLNNVAVAGTLSTNNIAKNSAGSPIVINSGLNASLGLRVYYDMNLYNTLVFTDSSWNSQGSISGSGSVVNIVAATATTTFTKYAGHSQEGGSFRAPIFYDSNDTGYYCDPASNSVLNGLYVNAYYNLSNDYKDINVYGDVNTYYVVLIQGEYLYSFGRYSVTRGYNWTGPDTWYIATHKGGLTLDWEWSGDTAWGGNDKAIRIIEFNESYSTMVAGLGYPVNGGVIIWLRGGGVGGAQYRIRTPIGSNATVTAYDGVSATNHSTLTTFTAADSSVFTTRANTNNVSAEILARYPVRSAASLYNDNNLVVDIGSGTQTKSGIFASAASVRAPIFYDTDNTTYYTDPSSLSNILELKTNKNWYDSSATVWGGGINMGGNNPSIGFQNTGSTWWYMLHHSSDSINFYRRSTSGGWNHDGIWDSSGNYIWQGSSVRAPIFYDQNNTAYYLDAASTSNLNILGVAGRAGIGGAGSRSTNGLTVGFTDNSAFAANTDVGDTDRMLSIVNESSTTNAMAVLAFRINPNGGTANAMLDIKYVQTGATNTSGLHYTFNHGGSFLDRFSILSSGNVGIGTTSPSGKLHVYNSAAVDTYLESGTSGTTGKLIFKTSDNADLNKYIMQESFYMVLNGHANEGFKFRDSNGNVLLSIFGAANAYASRVGIGTQTPAQKLHVSGIGYSDTDFRAPIFYDSNDTAYYLDPAGTSNLNKFSTFTMSYNDMNPMSASSPYAARYGGSTQYRNGTMGYGTVDCNVIFSNWGSGFIDTWSTPANAPGGSSHYVGFQGFHYNHQNNSQAYGFQMLYAGGSANRFFWRSAWPDLLGWVEMIHSGTIASQTVATSGSCTGSSASCTGNSATTTLATKATRANGNFYIDDNYGNTVVGVYSASRYQGVFAMGDSYKLAADGSTTGSLYGIAWSHPNAGGAAGNLNTHGALIMENGTFLAALSGSIRCRDDMRSPLFYDSNNTAYYLDPASTSNLLGLTVANTITGSITGNAGGSSASCTGNAATATSATFLNSSNYIQRIGGSGNYNTDFQNTPAGSVRHQGDDANSISNPGATWWFVDNYRHSNSSNYWGTQVAWGWEDNANRLATRNVSGGGYGGWVYYLNSVNYNSYSPTLTGTGASGTWSINVTGNAATVTNGLYTSSTLTAGNLSGTIPSGVLGNSTHYVGTTAIALNRGSASQTLTGVSIDGNAATATNGLTTSNYVSYSAFTASLTSTVDARAPIFYDSNDTSYYLDLNSSGSLIRGRVNITGGHGGSSLRVFLSAAENGAVTGITTLQQWCSEPGNTWDGAGFGYNVDNSLNEAGNVPVYYFGRPNTSFGQAYMRMTTDGNWYFYNTPNGSNTRYTTMVLERTGYVIASNSIRSPIFHDSDNTAYYTDPASTSNLLGLTVTNTITGSISGNAGTATILQTARTIGGVSFNGSASINLPGVNTAGNQNTSGSSASCTGLAASATTAGNVNGYSPNTGAVVNTIVVRDANNYIFANYINTNVSESENPSVNSFLTSNGDGYLRKSTVAHVKYTLSLSGTNTGDQTNISGSSGSCTGNAASVTDGVYLSTTQSISGVKTFSSAPIATNIAKAWVFYNMNNNTINASYNVSSVTDNGTGVCTVNFSTAMVDANYVVAGTATYGYDDQDIYAMILAVPRRSTAQQAGSCRLATEYIHAAQVYDCVAVRAVFYR